MHGCPDREREFDERMDKKLLKRLYNIYSYYGPLPQNSHLEGNFLLLWKCRIVSDHADGTVIQHATSNVDACTHCAYLFFSCVIDCLDTGDQMTHQERAETFTNEV